MTSNRDLTCLELEGGSGGEPQEGHDRFGLIRLWRQEGYV